MAMDCDLQPTLHGHLIDLRPLRYDDFEALFLAASDPLIWEQHPKPDRYKLGVFKKFFDEAMKSKGALAVIDRQSEQIIGTSRYCHLMKLSARWRSASVFGKSILGRHL